MAAFPAAGNSPSRLQADWRGGAVASQIRPAIVLIVLLSGRGLVAADPRTFVEAHIEGRALGLVGEPQVNVMKLNIALDALKE